MKKGFTLIELIGVVLILGLMVAIIAPEATKVLKKGTIKVDEQTKSSIVLAARNWAIDNKSKVQNNCYVTLQTLEQGEYVDIESYKLNDKDKTPITNSCVNITNGGKTFTWSQSCSGTPCS